MRLSEVTDIQQGDIDWENYTVTKSVKATNNVERHLLGKRLAYLNSI